MIWTVWASSSCPNLIRNCYVTISLKASYNGFADRVKTFVDCWFEVTLLRSKSDPQRLVCGMKEGRLR